MLSVPVSEKKTKEQQGKTQSEMEGYRSSGGWVGYDSLSPIGGRLSAQFQQAAMQRAYGNQAMLRKMGRSKRLPSVTFSPSSQSGILQRECACGNRTRSLGTCSECQQKEGMLPQRQAEAKGGSSEVPPIVHEILNSPGQPLEPETRTFMESRFGHDFRRVRMNHILPDSIQPHLTVESYNNPFEQEADRVADKIIQKPEQPIHFPYDFSHIRVHTDEKAAKSARAMNARAYTVGSNIVFASGQYAPKSDTGKKLLAHELTHTIQQKNALQSIVQRKLDKITQSDCKFTFELGIGIYGPRANGTLATLWQNRINSRWSTDIVCASNGNRCPVTMKSTVNAYPAKNWSWQVPESNAVYVEEPGYRDISAPLYKHWAEDADELTVVHETGHLMGLYDLYFGKYTLPGFENDIMGNYYTDPGLTQFSGALASIIFNHKRGCPCCFGAKKSASSVEDNEKNQDSAIV